MLDGNVVTGFAGSVARIEFGPVESSFEPEKIIGVDEATKEPILRRMRRWPIRHAPLWILSRYPVVRWLLRKVAPKPRSAGGRVVSAYIEKPSGDRVPVSIEGAVAEMLPRGKWFGTYCRLEIGDRLVVEVWLRQAAIVTMTLFGRCCR